MKNLLIVCVTATLAYLGYDAFRPAPADPVVLAQAPPAPVVPKLYFHSALDAPAMPTSLSTGTSYFSTEQSSRFSDGPGLRTTGTFSTGYPTYYVEPETVVRTTSSPASAAQTSTLAEQISRLRQSANASLMYRHKPARPTSIPSVTAQ